MAVADIKSTLSSIRSEAEDQDTDFNDLCRLLAQAKALKNSIRHVKDEADQLCSDIEDWVADERRASE